MSTDADRILTLDNVEEATGIPADTVRRWIDRGMPHNWDRVGRDPRRYYFSFSGLIEWSKRESKAEVAAAITPQGIARFGMKRGATSSARSRG